MSKTKEPIPTKRAPMQVARSGYPMERIAVDQLDELPVTERGNKYVLVVSDYFTKWTESYPMINMEAATVKVWNPGPDTFGLGAPVRKQAVC